MQQEDQNHQRHNNRFFQQIFLQRIHRPHDQVGTVVGNLDLHTGGEPFFQFRDLGLDPVDNILGVLAVAHDHDAAHRFTFTVYIQQAAPDGAAGLHGSEVFYINRRAAHIGSHDDILQIRFRCDVAPATDKVFGISLLDQPPPHILVGSLDCVHDFGNLDVVGEQFGRIQVDLVFPYQTADGSNLGHPLNGIQLIANEPVLQGTQLLQVIPFSLDGVPEHMPHTGAVRTESRGHAGGEERSGVIEPFQYPGPGPVNVGLVFKDDVNHGKAERGRGPYGTHLRQPLQIGCQRIGNLILHNLR